MTKRSQADEQSSKGEIDISKLKNYNTRYLDQLDYPTQYEFIAAIFRMGLLKKVQVRDWSR